MWKAELLFCFFAEDTGIFTEDSLFTKSLVEHTKDDGSDLQAFFGTLFEALDKKDKSEYPQYIQKFPYVNGKLFRDQIHIPEMTAKCFESEIVEEIFYNKPNLLEKILIRYDSQGKERTFQANAINKTINKFEYKSIPTVSKEYKFSELSSSNELLKILYSILNDEDKFSFLIDTFENRFLKQNMEFIEDDVIVSTVHGAKGLEWQYVVLPDMEQCVFPSYYSLCEVCRNKYNMVDDCFCKINMENTEKGSPFEKMFLDVLSVFYVAVTRAKKQVFLSASSYGVNSYGEKKALISCLLSLPGIKIECQ